MSASDPLKSLFNRSFEQENIPFDPQGWAQMEAMLDAKSGQTAGSFWLFGGAGLIGAGIAISLIANATSNVYSPRVAMADFSPIEFANTLPSSHISDLTNTTSNGSTLNTLTASISAPELNPITDERTVSSNTNLNSSTNPNRSAVDINSTDRTQETPTNNVAPASVFEAAAQEVATTSAPTLASSDRSSDGPSTDADASPSGFAGATPSNIASDSPSMANEDSNPVATPSIPADPATPAINPMIDETENLDRNDLAFMDWLPWQSTNAASDIIEDPSRTIEAMDRKFSWWLQAGFNRTLQRPGPISIDGFGQTVGAGASWRFKPHFLTSIGLNLIHQPIGYSQTEETTYHGFKRNTEVVTTTVDNLISLDVPLMIHYRWNRWMIGTGASLQYAYGARVTETRGLLNNSENPVSETFKEYASWDAITPFTMSIPLEVSYRIHDHYRLGMRYRHGIQPLFEDGTKISSLGIFIQFTR